MKTSLNITKTAIIALLLSATVSFAQQTFTIVSTDSANPTLCEYNTSGNKNLVYAYGLTTGSTDIVYGKTSGYNLTSLSSIKIESNVNYTHKNNMTTVKLTLEAGSSLTLGAGTASQRGGFAIYGNDTESIIEGSISTIGRMTVKASSETAGSTWSRDYYLTSIGWRGTETTTVTFKGNGSLTQQGVHTAYNDFTGAKNKIYGTLNLGTSEAVLNGSLTYDDFVYFMGANSTLNLYSSNKIVSGASVESITANKTAGYTNATSQGNSTFFVVGESATEIGKAGAAGLIINAFVENDFGAIDAYSGSTITLNTSSIKAGDVLSVEKLLITADASGNKSLTLNLNFAGDNTLQIENFKELYDSLGSDLSVNIFDSQTQSYVAGVLDTNYTVDASGFISTVAVPEPAEWAVIFGAIALAFVVYRRRM